MKLFRFLTILGSSILLAVATTNSATAQQTLGQCVSDLRRSGLLLYDALANCSDSVQIQSSIQTLGRCTGRVIASYLVSVVTDKMS